MKYISYFIICMAVFASCTQDGKYKAPETWKYSPEKNAYRVTKISGTNTHWGEFTLYVHYDKEELDGFTRVNAQNDTVGWSGMSRSSGTVMFEIQDLLPSVDNDSIHRLDSLLEVEHGKGNYYLWDSIPKSTETILRTTMYMNTDGSIAKLTSEKYRTNDSVQAVGKEFAYKYVLETTTTSTYEYNTDSRLCVERILYDKHNPVDPEIYTRGLYKTEAEYKNGTVVSVAWFTAPAGENFTEYNRYRYTYEGSRLLEIQGIDFSKMFAYDGNTVTVTTNGTGKATYTLDDNGYVVKMDDGKGNVYNIEYEPGHGNFSEFFITMSEQMINPFYIR